MISDDQSAETEARWSGVLAAWREGDFARATALARDDRALAGLSPILGSKTPLIIAQLGQSLDGRIAAQNGESRYINGPLALAHLHRLRALVDAVVVGAGTVSQDDPNLTVRRVAGDNPIRVAVDPRARLSRKHRLFSDGKAPSLRIVSDQVADQWNEDLPLTPDKTGMIAPADIAGALRRRGANRLLIEGGAKTIATFLQSGLIDRLHLLVGPIILGAGRLGIELPMIESLDQALRPTVTAHPLQGDTLFDCAF